MGQYYKPMILSVERKPALFIDTHDFGNGLKLMEHSYVGNEVTRRMEHALFNNPQRVVWAGDYADNEDGLIHSLYDIAELSDVEQLAPFDNGEELIDAKWLLNHDKKLAVAIPAYDTDLWMIHPLPLLTCEGNGRGGGDYHGSNMEHVGTWARNRISVSSVNHREFPVLDITFSEE